MAGINYSNTIDEIQKNIYVILSTNATIKQYAEKVLDGLGTVQERTTGYGKVYINSPETDEKSLTQSKILIKVTCEIECVTHKESQVRLLADAVRVALNNAKFAASNSTFAWNMSWFSVGKTSRTAMPLDDNTTEYRYSLPIQYQVVTTS